MKQIAGLATAVAIMFAASNAAAAITYLANRAVGTGFVNLSITTDGTIGVLAAGNIVGWSIETNDGIFSIDLIGPGDAQNSLTVFGSALTATTTNLYFDFGTNYDIFGNNNAPRSYVEFSRTSFMPFELRSFGWQNGNYAVSAPPSEYIFELSGGVPYTEYSGNRIVASTAIPEPATWALMIGGFGLAGAALRRRRVAAA
jgi:hypothetical protein